MASQLPVECLNDIIEYLEEDKFSLRSCLLVNRLWCTVAVRTLWRNVWNIEYFVPYRRYVPLSILGTLILCLSIDSKNLLKINGISIPTPPSNLPLFNYTSFIKVLVFSKIDKIIEDALIILQINTSNSIHLISQELLKDFMNQISSLKILKYDLLIYPKITQNIPFVSFPGAKDCLTDILEFKCCSNIYPKHIYQLSQISHNIQTLSITLDNNVSNGLKDLISSQGHLKSLGLKVKNNGYLIDIIPILTKHCNTLMRLHVYTADVDTTLSFVSSFRNLQELVISTPHIHNELQHIVLPSLQVFKIPYVLNPNTTKVLMKFLENNGKNLVDLSINHYMDKSLGLSVIQYCPNLKNLVIIIKKNDLDTLKNIFNSCQYLESLKIWCGGDCIDENEMLNIVAKYSPKNFSKLKIGSSKQSKLLPKELESFFSSWEERIPQKSLILNVTGYCGFDRNEKNITIIEKYKKLGIIKEFKTEAYDAKRYLYN